MERDAVPDGGKGDHLCRPSISGRILRRASHVLYLFFNWACTIVFVYQGYLWIRKGSWTKIPTSLLFSRGISTRPFFTESHGAGGLVRWCLSVDLIYTLGVIAMIFYAVKWLLERRERQRQGRLPDLSGKESPSSP